MSGRGNVFAIHPWEHADDLRRMEELLREYDPELAHYSVPPERAIQGTEAEVLKSLHHRIEFATAVLVMNAPGLHERPFSDFEMRIAVELRKRIVVVQPPGEFDQPIPAILDGHVYRYAPWRSDVVGRAIRGEYPQDGRVFDIAEVADRRELVALLAAGVAAVSLVVAIRTAAAFQHLQRELAQAGVELQWERADTHRVVRGVATGALLAGGLAFLLTGDPKATLIAAGAGGTLGGAVAAKRSYEAKLLGTSDMRVLALQPLGAPT